MLEAGRRDQLVTLQRATTETDDYGGSVETWADLRQEWAQVQFGTGAERRQAAQEGSTQAATFGLLHNPVTASLTTRDRIQYLGVAWDIHALNPAPRNKGIIITAVRAE